MSKPSILVSSCILGENVRYDGGNKLDSYISTHLAKYIDFKMTCPELLMGMGVPREPVNIVLDENNNKKMISIKTKVDYTDKALVVSEKIIEDFGHSISGAILQKKSPSCGVERVKVYNKDDKELFHLNNEDIRRGLFAEILMSKKPELPVIDSGRFQDMFYRENFFRRVYAYNRFFEIEHSIKELQTFHSRYKFILMEYDQNKMRELGKICSSKNEKTIELVFESYKKIFFKTIEKPPQTKNRVNVFYHLLGFLKNELSFDEKLIIHKMIEDYKVGVLPYLVPLKMIEFLVLKYEQYYLKGHYYFAPFPLEMLK